MRLFLGMDGGQTSTKVAVADESGRILGASRGGPCVHLQDEQCRAQVRETIYQVVHEALEAAGLSDSAEIASAFLGISGVAGPQSNAGIGYQTAFAERFNAASVHIDHDARNALAGAIPGMTGVVVIAGTGSIAFGMNEAGEEARAGGWGYLIGDPGSAFEIGRQALTAVLRAKEGLGSRTALTRMVLDHLSISEVEMIPQVVYQRSQPKLGLAEIGSRVSQVAKGGDPVAHGLIESAGRGLGEIAGAVIRRLFQEDQAVFVSGVGGVFRSGTSLWESYRQAVQKVFARAEVMPPELSPLAGSLLLAFRHAGLGPSPERLHRLHNTASLLRE